MRNLPKLPLKRRFDGSQVSLATVPAPVSTQLLEPPRQRSAAAMRASFARNRSLTLRDPPEEDTEELERPEPSPNPGLSDEHRHKHRHRHRHHGGQQSSHQGSRTEESTPRHRHKHRMTLRGAGELQGFAVSMDSAWGCQRGHFILASPLHRLHAAPPSSWGTGESHRPSFDSCCSSSIPWGSLISWNGGIHYPVVASACRSCGTIHDQCSLTSSSAGSANQYLPSVASAVSLGRQQGGPRRRHRHRNQHRHCRHCRHHSPNPQVEQSPDYSLPRRHRRVHPSARSAASLPHQPHSLDNPATLASLQETGADPAMEQGTRRQRDLDTAGRKKEVQTPSRNEPASNASVRQWMAGNPLVQDNDKPLPRSNSMERLSDPSSAPTARRTAFIKSYSDDLTGRIRARNESLEAPTASPGAVFSSTSNCSAVTGNSSCASKLSRLDSAGASQNANFLMVPAPQQKLDFDPPIIRDTTEHVPMPTLAADTFIYIEDWSNRSFDAHSVMTPLEFEKRRHLDARLEMSTNLISPVIDTKKQDAKVVSHDRKSDSLLFSSSSSLASSVPSSLGNSYNRKSPKSEGRAKRSRERKQSMSGSVSSGESALNGKPLVTSRRPKHHFSDSAYQTKENSTDSRARTGVQSFRVVVSLNDDRKAGDFQQPLLQKSGCEESEMTHELNARDEDKEWTCLTSKRLPNGFQLMSRVSEDAESEESGLRTSQSNPPDQLSTNTAHDDVTSQVQPPIAMEIFTILRPMREGTEDELEVSV